MRKPGEGIRCAYFREENRDVKHTGVRFREQEEGCRGPQGRYWNSGSRYQGPSSGRGVQPGKTARAAETGGDRKRRNMEKRKGTGATLGREGKKPRQRNARRNPQPGRETRKAVGAGSGADNLSNPLWDELGHALPGPGTPAREARPRFLPLPARGGGGGAGLGTPASAAGSCGFPGGCAWAVHPRSARGGWSRGPADPAALSPWTLGAPRRLAGKTSGLPAPPTVSAPLLLARDRGPVPAGPGKGKDVKDSEGSVNPGLGMQGLLERQPVRSRPWDSAWPARPFPCTVDSVKPDLSSAYGVDVEAD
ncbi:fibril-forming collagen alpha chain-like [Trachypithecus francoisi]|uniref:fibril-forming collagen alpha chain-like n=1 Tax=Trachypithecus francoisi TaxID=54180 RepID=UPI00141B10D1|nr:fibril-forming collagen alpha chain-like [Trachypithecus francoisi]